MKALKILDSLSDSFRKLRIGPRIGAGLGTVTVFMLVLVVVGLSSLQRVHHRMAQVATESDERMRLAHMLQDSVQSIHNSILTLVTVDEDQLRSYGHIRISGAWSLILDVLQQWEKMGQTEEGSHLVSLLKADLEARREAQLGIVQKVFLGRREEALERYKSSERAALTEMDRICAALVRHEEQKRQEEYRQAIESYRKVRNLFLLTGASVVGLAAVLVILLTRSITRPLREGVWVASRVAEGDFTTPIEPEHHDEPGQLLAALDQMRERLRKVKALEQSLIQSQKLETVGKLAGGVAHDFNNLLTVIIGQCQISLLNLKESNPLHSDFQTILSAAGRAATLTRQLLAFSRRQVMEMKTLNLNCVLRDTWEMLRRLLGEDIELSMDLAPDLAPVRTDPAQFAQVILNLAVNARDAMPEGGKLSFQTANVELDQAFVSNHPGATPGRFVMMAVTDTGVGMTKEVLDRVFEPFFTTKEVGKGTGLGLAMVYGTVKQSGGTIWAYSEPGQGTTFKIYLPVAAEESPVHAQKAPQRIDSPGGFETVLVVEDEDEVRGVVVRVLRQHGYLVLQASNGEAGLHLIRQYQDPIHLLLTDVVMPAMSGPQLVQAALKIRPEMKVVFMSGYTDRGVLPNGALDGGFHYLQKPLTVTGLLSKVREVLDGAKPGE
jgi:signal transduction histidine kinase/ActR/RegA family two-component response regulator